MTLRNTLHVLFYFGTAIGCMLINVQILTSIIIGQSSMWLIVPIIAICMLMADFIVRGCTVLGRFCDVH